MLSDIRKYSEPVKFSYMLMRPDGYVYDEGTERYYEIYEQLMLIEYLTANIEFNLCGFDELNISIPKWTTKRQKTVINPAWEKLQGNYIIEVSNNISDKKQRFIIDTIEKDINDKSIKNVSAYSLEREFSQKNLHKFSSKTLTKDNQELDETWYLRDILNHINKNYMDNTWSIGKIDGNVETKRRSFDVSSQSIWTFLRDLQESFCCIFKFDTINRAIDVLDAMVYPVCPKCHRPEYLVYYGSTLECYNPDCYIDVDDKLASSFDSDSTMDIIDEDGKHRTVLAKDGEKVNWTTTVYGKDTGLYLSERNYINDFKENLDMSEFATRLYVYGKDDLGINTATLNYGGQPYLEDFSYFRNKKYMTQELLDALDRYDALYESKKGEWKAINDEYYDLLRQHSEAVVVPERSQSLLDELQFEVKSITRLSQIQANGSSTEKLDTLKETFKDYNEQIIHYLDADGTVQEKKIIELLDDLGETITGIEGKVVDISKAIKAINDSFEYQFDIMEQALKDDINLDNYSLNQLEEALKVYNSRIDVLNNISKNIITADINSELTTGKTWETGDRIYYRLIEEDTDKGIAKTVFDNFDSPYTLSNATSEGYFEFNLPNKYTKVIRNNAVYTLQLWLAKKLSDGKYDDRVLQTENVHYYVMETGNTSGSIYKIRQNSIDLTVIKNALGKAIEQKKLVVAEIEKLQEKNAEKTTALKLSLNKSTAEDEQGLIFTDVLIRELNRFIVEKEYVNDNIGVADINTDIHTDKYKECVDELYQDGLTAFYAMSTPTIEFNIDIVNFMRDIRYQSDWNKISLGDMIHITHGDASKKDYIVRITQIQWNPTDNFIQLTLSNEDKFTSGKGFMEKMIKKINSTSTTVKVQKEKWNNAQSNAVDEILNTGWNAAISAITCGDDVNVITDHRGITIINGIDVNKQMRLMDGLLAFTDDNWNTTKATISNGNVLAENIVGRFLVGKNLYIVATKTDGTTLTFRVDGEGVKLDNGSLTILPMNGNYADSNGITLSPDPHEGFKCTGYDSQSRKCFEIKMNGQDGLLMYTLNANGEPKTYMLKADVNGNLTVNGVVYAKDLFLGAINQSVITYIDAKTGTKVYYDPDNPNQSGNVKDVIAAIQGQHISCAGLMIKNGNSMFCIDEDAKVTIKNGEIHMINGNNELWIDADNFIRWAINGQDKFYYDKELDAIVFKGKIIGSEIYGSNIYGGKFYDEDGKVYITIGGEKSSAMGDLTIYNNNGERFKIEDQATQMYLKSLGRTFIISSGSSTIMKNTWEYGGSEVATKADLERLEARLSK